MLLTRLTPQERMLLTYHADEAEVLAGRPLIEQGEGAEAFFVILEGAASVVRDGQELTSLGVGDFFGEIALLETGLRTASVIAETDMRVLVVPRHDFEPLLDALPLAAGQIRRVALQRFLGIR
jgi:CRP/FNR family cyclic AMP-dependent transcriptional regulator